MPTNSPGSAGAANRRRGVFKPPSAAPVFLSQPTITGTPQVGVAIGYVAGTLAGVPTPTVTQQWIINGVDVPGSTALTYTPQASDAGKTLAVRMLSDNGVGTGPSSTSIPKTVNGAPTVLTNPAIIGSPAVGVAVSYTAGTYGGFPAPTITGRQWLRAGSPITGATGATYTPVGADIGTNTLSVRETVGNAVGSIDATSAPATVAAGSAGADDWAARSAGALMANRLDTSGILAMRLIDGTQDHISLDTAIKVDGAAGSAKIEVRNTDGSGSGQLSVPFGRTMGPGSVIWVAYRVRQPAQHLYQPWPPTTESANKLSIISRDANGVAPVGSNQLNEVVIQNNNQGGHISGYRRNGGAQGQTDFLPWDRAFSSPDNGADFRAQPALDRGANRLTGTNPDTGAAWTAGEQTRARYGLMYSARSSPRAANYEDGFGDPLSGGFKARPDEWVQVLQCIEYVEPGQFASRVRAMAAHEGGTYQTLWDEHGVVLGNGPDYNAVNLLPYTTNRLAGGRKVASRTNSIPGLTIHVAGLGTPIGAGTIEYNATTKRFRWSGFGEAFGTARGFSEANGILTINVAASGAADSYLVITADPALLPSSGTLTDTVTIADGRNDTQVNYTDVILSHSPIVEPGGIAGSSSLSALAKAAAQMAPGTWVELPTTGLVAVIRQQGFQNPILQFTVTGAWDPVAGKCHVLGGDHGNTGLSHIVYDEATNTWTTFSANIGINGHGYQHTVADHRNGNLYHTGYGNQGFYRKTPSGAWTRLADFPSISNITYAAFAWTGPMTGLTGPGVAVWEAEFGQLWVWGLDSSTWQINQSGYPSVGVYHQVAAYSRKHNCAVVGGGNDSSGNTFFKEFYRINSDRTHIVYPQASIPSAVRLGVRAGAVVEDPATGDFLVFTNRQVYQFNPLGSNGTWTLRGSIPAPVNTFEETGEVACAIPIRHYGVVMVISSDASASNTNVYLYKNA